MAQPSYQAILHKTFEERVRFNPRYTMRSYARDLGMAPSSLSEVLKGKKGISAQKAVSVAQALRLPEWENRLFRDLVTKDHSRSHHAKEEAKKRVSDQLQQFKVEHLKAEATRALTSWLDLALLEATHLKDFQPGETWLAQKLGVNPEEIRASTRRLEEVGLLKISPEETWTDVSPLFSTTDGIPSSQIRNFHRSVLRLAEQKMDETSLADRVLKSAVFSLADDQVPEAKGILDEAIARILALAEKNPGPKDHVLCFGSQLFFLLKGEK